MIDFSKNTSRSESEVKKADYMKRVIASLIQKEDIYNAKKKIEQYEKELSEDKETISFKSILMIKEGKLEAAEEILLRGLSEYWFDFDLLYNLMYVYECFGYDNIEKVQNTIKDCLEKNDFEDYNLYKYLYSEVCVLNGFIRLGGIIREKALEYSYKKLENGILTQEDVFSGYKASIEKGDFEKSRDLIEKLKDKKPSESIIKDVLYYYYLNIGNREKIAEISKEKILDSDKDYLNYINGKTVAIVGPAPSEEDSSGEIDSYDVVIRITYRGKEFIPESGFGSKTDVSYYNLQYANVIREYEDKSFFEDLDYSVFKLIQHDFQEELSKENRGRSIFLSNHLTFNGHWNMVPMILCDIFQFNPKSVKIFNSNFFLSSSPYYKDYSPEEALEWDKLMLGLGSHDIITQVNFVKNLWRAGLIQVDNDCERVLMLSKEEYLKEFEDIYVKSYYDKLGRKI